MVVIKLVFPDPVDLLDFELKVLTQILDVDPKSVSILGLFADAEIELAINGYNAKVAA